MKITQVDLEFVKQNLELPNLFRITACDDGNYGKHHLSARIKSIKSINVGDIFDAEPSDGVAYILIDDYGII